MLKPLLLLCWAAIFVSAGDQKDVITNQTSVPSNSAGSNLAINLQPPNSKLPVDENTHLPSTNDKLSMSPSEAPDLNPKSTTSASTTSTEHTTNDITTPKPTTKPTTAPTTITTPSTVAPTTVPIHTTTTPLPPPTTGKWKVEENNVSCIIIQMAAQFNISYTDVDKVTIHKAMDIPINSTATGKCGKTEQDLTLSWEVQDSAENNFTLYFVKNDTQKRYCLDHLKIFLVPEKIPSNKSNETITLVHMAPQYDITLSNSYRCLKEQKLALTLEGKNETIGYLTVSNLQFQAFRSDNTTIFGLAKDCSFDTPDIVPITVGCALAGLVVIVLIAYLVGRRRSQARGYLSM